METNLRKWIVYCTTNIINNKIYIGVHKTEDPTIFDNYIGCNVKINHPSSYMNPTTPFQFAVKKYGPKNFKRVVLKIFDTEEEAFALEAELVNLDFIKRKDTYNVSIGGNGGRPGKPIYQFDFNGTFLKKWESISDVCEFYNISWMSIWNASYYKLSRRGFYWSYDKNINPSEYCNNAGTYVYKYDGETYKLIDEYESIHEASRVNGVKMDQIQRSIRNGYKAHGYFYTTKCLESYSGVETINIKNKPIYVYLLDGTFVKEFSNTKDLKVFLNIKNTAPIQASLRSRSAYKDYQFSIEKLDRMEPLVDKRKIKKKVGKYSLSGDLLQTYETVTAARNEHGAGVSRCLRGQQKSCHNFIFKYIS